MDTLAREATLSKFLSSLSTGSTLKGKNLQILPFSSRHLFTKGSMFREANRKSLMLTAFEK